MQLCIPQPTKWRIPWFINTGSSTEMILASNGCILFAKKLPAACNISIGSTHKQMKGTRLMRVSSPIEDGYALRRDSRVACLSPGISITSSVSAGGDFKLVSALHGVTLTNRKGESVIVEASAKHFLLTALIPVVALYCSLALAQEETAALNGQITDADDLAVIGVKVQALHTGTNISYLAYTKQTGLYNFPTLPAGTYNVTATKDGFRQGVRPGVELHVSDVIRLNFSLQVGSVAESATVEGGALLVETTSSEIGGLITSKQIEDLPLNGRNYIDLSLLQAGVTNSLNSTGTSGFAGMTGTVYSSNGAPVISNNFLLDGTQIANQSDWGTASFAGTTLGVDGILEYKVLTSAYDASYGMSMGSEMVMISKGGTNQYHGDVFEYLRNSALNARNYFDGAKIPQLEKNNFGASFGGPIRKGKIFFFAVYEGLEENLGFTANDLVPEAGCHGPAGAVITETACPSLGLAPGGAVTIANADTAALLSLYPNSNDGANNYIFGPSTKIGVNYGQIRFDQSFSASDTFFARYTIDLAKVNSASNQGIPITSGTAFLNSEAEEEILTSL
jgi:hypothetical protein